MKKDIKPFLFFSIIASLLVGHLANRTALIFEGLTGNLVENMQLTFDGGERTMQFYFTTTNPVKMITDDQTDPTYLKSLV